MDTQRLSFPRIAVAEVLTDCCEFNERSRVQEEKCVLCGEGVSTSPLWCPPLWDHQRNSNLGAGSNHGFIFLSIATICPTTNLSTSQDGFAFGSSRLRLLSRSEWSSGCYFTARACPSVCLIFNPPELDLVHVTEMVGYTPHFQRIFLLFWCLQRSGLAFPCCLYVSFLPNDLRNRRSRFSFHMVFRRALF